MRADLAAARGGIDRAYRQRCRTYELRDDDQERLLKAADIVTYARTAVERDYHGDVIDAHAPEMPTRFAKQLAQMVRGGIALGMSRGEAMRLAMRCARDSIPPLRLEILLDLASNPRSRAVDVCRRITKPYRTVRRELEALHMLGLLRCDEEQSVVDESQDRLAVLAGGRLRSRDVAIDGASSTLLNLVRKCEYVCLWCL